MLPSDWPTNAMREPSKSVPRRVMHRRNRVRELEQIGDALTQVVARGQKARKIDEPAARRIDRAIRTRRAGRVVLEVEIERALGRAERGERRVADVERIGRVGDAVQRQIDRDDRETLRGERAGDRERIGAVARDAVLEDHDRPAGGRLGVARARVRQRHHHRHGLRRGRDRERIAVSDVRRGRIETETRALRNVRAGRRMPELVQRRDRILLRSAPTGNTEDRSCRCRCRQPAAGRHQDRRASCRSARDASSPRAKLDDRVDRLQHGRRLLRRRDPRQRDRARRNAGRAGRGFLRIRQLAQRLERARLRSRQRGNGRLAAGAERRSCARPADTAAPRGSAAAAFLMPVVSTAMYDLREPSGCVGTIASVRPVASDGASATTNSCGEASSRTMPVTPPPGPVSVRELASPQELVGGARWRRRTTRLAIVPTQPLRPRASRYIR